MRQDHLKPFLKGMVLVAAVSALPAAPLQVKSPHPEAVGQRPDAPVYARHGPYWVGIRQVVLKADGGRAFQTTLWYPALNPKAAKEEATIRETTPDPPPALDINSRALLDAPPDPSARPYPLVVFVHGRPDEPNYHACHLAHLASHGFIVIGADFEWRLPYRPPITVQTINFARKLNAAGSPFAGMIDASRVAVEGFSMGGPGALEMGGASSLGNIPGSQRDPRVKAIISIAPYLVPDQWNFSAVKLPSLLMICSKDENVPLDTCSKIYQALPASRKSMAVLSGGTHRSFLNPELPGARFGTLDKGRTVDLFNHFVTAFLLDTLRGDANARKAMLPEAVRFEDVKYTATLK